MARASMKRRPSASAAGAIRRARGLHVDREHEPRIGVAEAGLRGLEIDAVEHECRPRWPGAGRGR